MEESVNIINRAVCTGCGSCVASCPNQAIHLNKISEGFYMPFIDGYRCSQCGACSRSCSVIAVHSDRQCGGVNIDYFFAAQDMIRWNCDDGGAKQVIMMEVLKQGGKVFAPCFTEDFRSVTYKMIGSLNELEELVLADYVESDMSEILPLLREQLEMGRYVFFLGTPCRVAGLHLFLKTNYNNLLLGTVLCHGVTSQSVWQEYLHEIAGEKTITSVRFGAKELGWRQSVRIRMESEKTEFYEGLDRDPFFKAYNMGICLRKCCSNCEYQEMENVDFTFGNYWDIKGKKPAYKDSKGISFLAVHTVKAQKFLEKIKEKAQIADEVPKGLEYKQKISFDEERRNTFFSLWEMNGIKKALGYMVHGIETKSLTRAMAIDYHSGDAKRWIIKNSNVWRETHFDGCNILFANGTTSFQWIYLPLDICLIADVQYEYDIKIKVQTTAREVRLMLTDRIQNEEGKGVICQFWSQNVPDNTWLRIHGNYTPNRNTLKYLFLASTDFMGEGSYVCFDWIRMWEGGRQKYE